MTAVLETPHAPSARPTPASARRIRQRVVYVVSHYPLVSHVFVQREVRALRALGNDVHVVSIHRADAGEILSGADAEEAASTRSVFPLEHSRFGRAHARALFRHPRAYFATARYALRRAPSGARAHLWQLFYFAEAIVVWDACRALRIRHLHSHFANVAADVGWLAAEFGGQADPSHSWDWTFTMHGCVEFWDVDRFNLARKVAAASLVICISEHTRAQLMALTEPRYWPQLQVVHCGVDLDQYHPSAARAAHEGPVEVLCVGRLSPEKGHLVLLDALAALSREGVALHVTVVGDGPLRDELLAHAEAVGVADMVSFVGALGQDELPARYRAADVFCQPSFNEGIPVVLMEAMASGLPVVSAAVGAVGELVADGESGLLVTAARPDALADALRQLANSAELRAAMGARGREVVAAHFDIETSAGHIADLFAAVADGTAPVTAEHEPGPVTRLW